MSKLNEQRQKIIDLVVEKLEEGVIPWRKGWTECSPFNPTNGKGYRGINNLYLSMVIAVNELNDPRFMTFNQVKEQGYKIKPGAKSLASVEYFAMYDNAQKQNLNLTWWRNLSHDEKEKYQDNIQVIFKSYPVFNGSQIEGITPYTKDKQNPRFLKNKLIHIVDELGLNIVEGDYDRIFYAPHIDKIFSPRNYSFIDDYEFNTAIAHELCHATGHPTRLNRDLGGVRGSSRYAIEELRAEIGAMFIAQDLNMELDVEDRYSNHAAYIQAWLEVIKSDQKAFFRAVNDANDICDYIDVLDIKKTKYPSYDIEDLETEL